MKLKKLIILPVPVSDADHPEPPNNVLPKHEFTMGIIAPKGAGKTTLIANLLYFYKGYFNNIYVFSPTVLSDEKWDWLKNQELCVENTPLKKWIALEKKKEQGAFHNKIVADPPISKEFDNINTNKKEDYDGRIPEENFYHNYSHQDLNDLLVNKKAIIDALKKHNQPKFLADRDLFIFDDLVGSSLFSMAKDNCFKGFNTRHRHYSASVIMVSQGYKEIPKTVRTNWTCLIIFEIANDREVRVIYEENTMGYKEKQWLEMFDHCVKDDYGFMYLNAKKPKRFRCMKNFDKVLFFDTIPE